MSQAMPPQQPNQGHPYPQGQPMPQGQPYPQQGYTGATTPVQPPKKKHTGCIIAAAIVGLLLLIGMVSCGALLHSTSQVVNSAVASQSQAANATHKVTYKVTTNGKATITYGPMSGTSQQDITSDWSKDADIKGDNDIVDLMVTSDYQNANADVTCEILVDGKSVSKNEGKGAGSSASCNAPVK